MRYKLIAAAAFAALAVSSARADEGMWTFDNFPSATMKAKHGFGPDQAWLDRVRQSAVRLSSGCSASTVSPNGLVLTNWHCVSDCIQSLSTKQDDYAADGFLAKRAEDEKTCPGVQAEILMSITDVTPRVKAAIAGKAAADVAKARQGEIARIEEEGCKTDKKLQCEVVSLYRGGQYKLYTYRKYEDVRLAFAPETSTGFFGGDPDNFNFPRFCRSTRTASRFPRPRTLRGRRMCPRKASRFSSPEIRARRSVSSRRLSLSLIATGSCPRASSSGPSSAGAC
jgi:hypothetical protein